MKFTVLVAHVCFYLILTLIAFALAHLMSTCKARAETEFNKVWFTDAARESLEVGFNHKAYRFSLGLEYTEHEVEEGTHETFGASAAFSLFNEWGCDWEVRLGGGAGFLLEIDWKSEEYDIFGNVINYPDVEAETYFFLNAWGSVSYDVLIISVGVRVNDLWVSPSFSVGVQW